LNSYTITLTKVLAFLLQLNHNHPFRGVWGGHSAPYKKASNRIHCDSDLATPELFGSFWLQKEQGRAPSAP